MAETVQTLTVEAKDENLDQVMQFTENFLAARGCPMKIRMQLGLCVEEIFVNIAHYAYGGEAGTAEIRLDDTQAGVTLTFLDSGVPYDPLAKEDPDITLSAEERQIGGLGIYLVKKNTDAVSYRYENGKNVLVLLKKIPRA